MTQNEENHLIVEALRSRTDASRKLRLLSDHLLRLGSRLKQLGEQLSPLNGNEPDWERLHADFGLWYAGSDPADGFLDIDNIKTSIAERIELQHTVEEKSARLRGYGVE